MPCKYLRLYLNVEYKDNNIPVQGLEKRYYPALINNGLSTCQGSGRTLLGIKPSSFSLTDQ